MSADWKSGNASQIAEGEERTMLAGEESAGAGSPCMLLDKLSSNVEAWKETFK